MAVATALLLVAVRHRERAILPPPPRPPATATIDAELGRLIDRATAAVEADRANAAAWRDLGEIHVANGLLETARACLLQATALAPRDARAWFHLGRVHAELLDVPAAVEAFARAREADPTHAASSWRAGFALLSINDLAGARREFEHALVANPGEVAALAGLARVAIEQGDGASAERILAPALERRPDDPRLRFLLGTALRLQGRLDAASVELERGRGTHADWHDPWEAATLAHRPRAAGRIHHALAASAAGDHARAIAMLEPLAMRRGHDPSVILALATAYEAAGRPADAIATLEGFVASAPATVTTDAAADDETAQRLAARARLEALRAGGATAAAGAGP